VHDIRANSYHLCRLSRGMGSDQRTIDIIPWRAEV
jgi:hypothetical protein